MKNLTLELHVIMVHTMKLVANSFHLYKYNISGMSEVSYLNRGRRILYVVIKHFNTNLMMCYLNYLRKCIVLPLKGLYFFLELSSIFCLLLHKDI